MRYIGYASPSHLSYLLLLHVRISSPFIFTLVIVVIVLDSRTSYYSQHIELPSISNLGRRKEWKKERKESFSRQTVRWDPFNFSFQKYYKWWEKRKKGGRGELRERNKEPPGLRGALYCILCVHWIMCRHIIQAKEVLQPMAPCLCLCVCVYVFKSRKILKENETGKDSGQGFFYSTKVIR